MRCECSPPGVASWQGMQGGDLKAARRVEVRWGPSEPTDSLSAYIAGGNTSGVSAAVRWRFKLVVLRHALFMPYCNSILASKPICSKLFLVWTFSGQNFVIISTFFHAYYSFLPV